MQYYRYEYTSPIGELDIVSHQDHIVGLWFRETTPKKILHEATVLKTDLICKVIDWLDSYFSGTNPSIEDIPLKMTGTNFQQAVWAVLNTIPYGQTMTYGQVSKIVALQLQKERMSAQAVGHAVGANPVSIIVPCHRVIGSNGKLVGYAAGVDKKQYLLNLEQHK